MKRPASENTMNPDYRCVLVNPAKPVTLRAETFSVIVKGKMIENFSVDKRGRKIRGKIRLFIPE